MITASSAPNARTIRSRTYTRRHVTVSMRADRPTHTPMMTGYCDWALTSGEALRTHPDDIVKDARVTRRSQEGEKTGSKAF